MRTIPEKYRFSVFVFLILAAFGASAAGPIGASLQTAANPNNAADGTSGTGADAVITVVATLQNSRPAAGLGDSDGDGSAEITLPEGWAIMSDFNNPANACEFSVTEFTNAGSGIYTIRVVPDLNNGGCTWEAGDYHYVVRMSQAIGRGKFRRRLIGSILGTVSVP